MRQLISDTAAAFASTNVASHDEQDPEHPAHQDAGHQDAGYELSSQGSAQDRIAAARARNRAMLYPNVGEPGDESVPLSDAGSPAMAFGRVKANADTGPRFFFWKVCVEWGELAAHLLLTKVL